mmetsp:Transcript_3649/g.5392  ORF Transcript_3649/g.5392 Transcript_3649/m.5392 type:complete len:309 (+) Transcript_3649:20-946(+)
MGKQVGFDTRRVSKEVNGNIVDDSKGMILQMGKLGKLYQPWIHIPYKKNSIFMFSSGKSLPEKTIEVLSHVPWYAAPLLWGPVIMYQMSWAQSLLSNSFLIMMALYAFAAIFLWSTFEYCVHRWLFHMLTDSPFMNMFHFMIHGVHHLTPSDPDRGIFPPAPAILGMFIPVHTFGYIFGNYIVKPLLGMSHETELGIRLATISGFMTGYVTYECIHWYYHNGAKPPKGFLYNLPFGIGDFFIHLRKCHMQHHFVKGAEVYNFALTPFVKLFYDDLIFKTGIDPSVTKFPDVYTYDEDEENDIFKVTAN